MPSTEKRRRTGQLRWYARNRDPRGTQLVKVFDRKLRAERFLTTVEASTLTGSFTVSPHSLRHYSGACLISRGVSVVAISCWLGHSSPETTCRVHAYVKPNDELAGRAALAETMRSIAVYPLCTRQASE